MRLIFSYIADTFRKLFLDTRFSEQGSNSREREEKVYMFFLDYLEECEQGSISKCTVASAYIIATRQVS